MVPCFHKKFLQYSERHSTYSKQSPQDASSGHLQEDKNNGKYVVVVAHERWLFTRGSVCRDLTGKILVF